MKRLSFTLLALFCFLQIVNAQTLYWNGPTTTGTAIVPSGGTGTWAGATTNWVTGNPGNSTAWAAANTASFIGTAATVTVGAAESAKGITFGVTGYTLAGSNAITITGATPTIALGAGFSSTINAPLNTASGTALTISGSSSPVFSSGGGNTFGGNVTISTTGGSAASTFSGNNTFSGTLTIAGTGGPTENFNGSNTFTGLISTTGTGTPTLNFSGANNFAGGITLTTAARINGNAAGAFGTSGNAGTITVSASGSRLSTLSGASNFTNVVINTVTLNPSSVAGFLVSMGATTGTNAILNWQGPIGGAATVFFGNNVTTGANGSGQTVISGSSNTWTGPTVLNMGGYLQCAADNCLPQTTQLIYGNSVTPLASGFGDFDLNGHTVNVGSIETQIAAGTNYGITNSNSGTGATLIIKGGGTSNANATFAAVIGANNTTLLSSTYNNITLEMTGSAGKETLTANNTFTGGMILNAGTLITGINNALAATLPVTLNGGTLSTGATTGYTQGSISSPLGTLTVGSSGGTLNMGTGSNSIYFANSSAVTWNGTLTVTGWTGSNHIYVGSDNTGLTSTQLTTQVTFSGGSYNGQHANILPSGEIVPTGANIASLGAISPATGSEAGSTVFTVTVNATVVPANGTTASFSISGILASEVSGGSLTGTVTFNGSSTSATTTFTVQNDNIFEGNETGSVVLTGATGSLSVNTTPATFVLYDDATYYWNGGTPTAGTTVTPNGGTGTWDVTNSWVGVATGSTGTGTTWVDGYPAIIAGGQGTVSINGTNTPTINPVSTTVNTTNDVITPNSATAVTLSGNIVLGGGSAVNLDLNDPTVTGTAAASARTLILTGTSLTGNAGSTFTVSGAQGLSTTVYSNVELQPSVVSGVYSTTIPFIMNGTGGGYVALNYNGGNSGIGLATPAGSYTMNGNGTNGAVQIANTNNATVILGGKAGYTLTVNGITAANTNTSPVWISNKPGGSGAGTFIFKGTSNYYGPTYLATNAGAIVQCSGNNSLSPNSALNIGSSTLTTQGPELDLNGTNQIVAGLASTTGTTNGGITNTAGSGTGTLTINQPTATATSFSLPITDGSTAKTAIALAGADNTTSLTLKSTGNTFTGGLTINANGNLITGAANVLASGLPVTLNGGTFTTGSSTGYTNTAGLLTLSAPSTIAFVGTTGHTLTFSNASGISNTTALTVTGWSGTPGASGTAAGSSGKLIINTTLSSTQLASINFVGYANGASQISGTNEIVPSSALLTATLAAVSPTTGSETAGTTYTITVNTTLIGVATSVVHSSTVNYTITGIQASQLASGALTGTLTINPGSSTGTITFTVHNDNIFEGTETGTVSISSPTGDIGFASATTQTFTLVDDANFYWNGGTPANNPATGGTGTWNTTNAWIAPVNDGTGVQASWQPGNYNAYLVGTAGVITFASSPNPGNTYVQANNYTFTTSTSPANIEALGGTINLPASYNLNIFTPATTTTKELDINGLTSGAGSTLTINQGAATTVKSDQLDFVQANSTIAADINIVSAVTSGGGAGSVVGIVGNAANVTVSGSVTNTSSQYAYTLLGVTGGTNTMTISGAINSSAPVNFANGTTGGAGTLLLTNTANSFTTAYFNGSAPIGCVKAGPAGSIPTTAVFVMGATSGNGQNFDLNGNDVTIASLSSNTGGTGVITNSAASGTNTLTVNQSGNTSFGLVIQDGSTAKTALAKSGAGTLSITGLNTFTGGLSLNAGTVEMGASGNLFANNLPFTFNGGSFKTGAAAGYSETVGAINLSNNSTIYLGTGSHSLKFSSAGTFTSGKTLTIYGWVGSAGSSGTAGQVFVGTDNTALTASQLDQINFNGFTSPGAIQLTTGEIVPAAPAYTWTGATSTAWATITNWTPVAPAGGPHSCTADVVIPVVGTNYPAISTAVSIGNVTINDNAQLTLTAPLSVCGNVTGGTSSAANVLGTSALTLTGGAAQALSGVMSVDNIEIANTSGGVSSTGNLAVNKSMVMTQGNFSNSGSVILVSSATGDAYYDDFTSGTAGSYSGNLTVQRYVSNPNLGYRDLSSPVNTTVGDLGNSISIRGLDGVKCWYSYNPYPTIQVYEENMSIATGVYYERWLSYTGTSNSLSPMKGIAARTDNTGDLLQNPISLTGTPNTGNNSITVTSTHAGNGKGWNFIGNPYPSPIKWSLVKALNSNIANSSYYVFHTTAQYGGSWGAHNGVTGVNGANDEIASSQGFFVQTLSSSNTFVMNNTVRTRTAGSYYGAVRQLDNEVRLVLTNGTNSDEVVTYTDAQATNGYDPGLDAVKMPAGSTVNLAYSLPGYDYAINVMAALDEQTVLPLTITVEDSGSYNLNAVALNVPGLTAYLQDAINGSMVNLDSTSSVPLVLNGGQTYTGRYAVVFRPNAVSGITNIESDFTSIYSSGNTVHIQRSGSEPAVITVTNILGQNISEFNSAANKLEFNLQAGSPWYAIVKVAEGKKVTVSKVLISNN